VCIFPVSAFKVIHRVILLTRFCKLLMTVAILFGGGHVHTVLRITAVTITRNSSINRLLYNRFNALIFP